MDPLSVVSYTHSRRSVPRSVQPAALQVQLYGEDVERGARAAIVSLSLLGMTLRSRFAA
jgi:hypothetical protein